MQIPAPGVAPQEAADQNVPASDSQDIVVTGTLIRNPNLEQSTPVNVTSADTIELKQSNVAEEVLRELPGVVPSIGSAVNNGNGGASFVDLRGLGSIRNIVLLDGNRIAPSGLAGRVDLNNIPLALVDRVDALTGAAVTTYGADAITGVVNFITRKDFAGVEADGFASRSPSRATATIFRSDLDPRRQLRRRPRQRGPQRRLSAGRPRLSGRARLLDHPGRQLLGRRRRLGHRGSVALHGHAPDRSDHRPAQHQPGGWQRRRCARSTRSPASAIADFATFNFNPFNVFQTPFERFNIFGQAHYEVSRRGRSLWPRHVLEEHRQHDHRAVGFVRRQRSRSTSTTRSCRPRCATSSARSTSNADRRDGLHAALHAVPQCAAAALGDRSDRSELPHGDDGPQPPYARKSARASATIRPPSSTPASALAVRSPARSTGTFRPLTASRRMSRRSRATRCSRASVRARWSMARSPTRPARTRPTAASRSTSSVPKARSRRRLPTSSRNRAPRPTAPA